MIDTQVEILGMLDSRASCHMIENSKVSQEPQKTLLVSIGLPSRTNTIATHQGTMTLGGRLKLNSVLYVPSLQCNLISIVELCKDLKCVVTFSHNECVLNDHTSRTLIGVWVSNNEESTTTRMGHWKEIK